jgi:hypothetical protein
MTQQLVTVRLFNDGPGTAVEVQVRLGADGMEPSEWSPSVRAMQPGEVFPPREEGLDGISLELPKAGDTYARSWYIETEFSDVRGARWRLRNDRSQSVASAYRLRSSWIEIWRPRT